jgi:hypothetical protein
LLFQHHRHPRLRTRRLLVVTNVGCSQATGSEGGRPNVQRNHGTEVHTTTVSESHSVIILPWRKFVKTCETRLGVSSVLSRLFFHYPPRRQGLYIHRCCDPLLRASLTFRSLRSQEPREPREPGFQWLTPVLAFFCTSI